MFGDDLHAKTLRSMQ